MPFEVITTVDKQQRDQIFHEMRQSALSNEKQVTKFGSSQLVDGSPAPQWASSFSVAYPLDVEKQNHGSKANPRKFPPRKSN
jgi:hypothetical protein